MISKWTWLRLYNICSGYYDRQLPVCDKVPSLFGTMCSDCHTKSSLLFYSSQFATFVCRPSEVWQVCESYKRLVWYLCEGSSTWVKHSCLQQPGMEEVWRGFVFWHLCAWDAGGIRWAWLFGFAFSLKVLLELAWVTILSSVYTITCKNTNMLYSISQYKISLCCNCSNIAQR